MSRSSRRETGSFLLVLLIAMIDWDAGLHAAPFGRPQRFVLKDSPIFVVTGDFTGDGRSDVVTASVLRNNITLLRGNGDGSLASGVRYPTGVHPIFLVSADLDGDGLDDVVVADSDGDPNQPAGDLALFLGRAAGALLDHGRLAVGRIPLSVAAGDLDGDADPDLVSCDGESDSAHVLLNDGDAGFTPLGTHAIGHVPTYALLLEVNGDGVPDFAATSFSSDSVSVHLGDGGGAFAPGVALRVSHGPNALAAGDFNQDGREDLAVLISGGGQVLILQNAGGTLEPAAIAPVGSVPTSLLTADFDQDGDLDLVTVNGGSRDLSFVPGRGDGTFDPEERFARLPLPNTAAQADMDGDGRPDLIVSDFEVSVWVFLNRPGGTPNAPPIAEAGPGQAVACSNSDGTPVLLDGSASSDLDSTPGTNDDIVAYDWFEDYGAPGERFLGSGDELTVQLDLGTHHITLRVTDRSGATGTDALVVNVHDMVAPNLSVIASPGTLWPPNHEMLTVVFAAQANDECGAVTVALVDVVSSEPDDAEGGGDGHTTADIQGAETGTTDFQILLRAERSGAGGGRFYSITYVAIDEAGNRASATARVFVAL